ncbi:platelet-derived growth factor receptor alpha-like [Tachyglossus aculeatus]|uniref:platelet-derived growth factor receptor alpha-like n=1 Tax=Tachyglossus aculeatus TaxID=9261 RepID=UPI0018F4F8F2|nr:platelet-derived growth factor receptor alpha-like [Tachyglossus aculeatus]
MPPSDSAGPGSGDQSVADPPNRVKPTPEFASGHWFLEGGQRGVPQPRFRKSKAVSCRTGAATRSLPIPGSRHDAKQGGAGVAPEQVSLWDSEISWRFPTLDDESSGLSIRSEKNNCSNFLSVLEVANALAVHTGLYTCYYNDTQAQGTGIVGRNIYVYVPDPDVTFVPSVMVDHFIVVEEGNSTVIPCRPTDPQAQVTLHASNGKEVSAIYDRRGSFLGHFATGSYTCETTIHGRKFQTPEFSVHTLRVSQEIVLEMEAPKTVYKKGETIVVTCSVLDIEPVDFQWKYPGEARDKGVVTMDKITVPSVKLVFTLTVPNATAKDRGSYECAVSHVTREVQQTKVVTIAVLEKGFVWLQPVSDPVEAVNLHSVWHFDVDLEAYPPSRVSWLKNNESLTKNTTGISTGLQKTDEYRYQSRLKLIRAKEDDRGHYTIVVQNEDDIASYTFELRVHGRLLGSGAFGQVVEGTANGLSKSQPKMKVAVKILGSASRYSERQALLVELDIMMHLGPHLNVANLLGACTQSGPIYIIMEYCLYGDLGDYLRKNRNRFLAVKSEKTEEELDTLSPDDKSTINYTCLTSEKKRDDADVTQEVGTQNVSKLERKESSEYVDLHKCLCPDKKSVSGPLAKPEVLDLLSDDGSEGFGVLELLSFSYQVSRGMEFLALRNTHVGPSPTMYSDVSLQHFNTSTPTLVSWAEGRVPGPWVVATAETRMEQRAELIVAASSEI